MSLPSEGVLIGIDYGTKRVGVAVSDMYQRYSSPYQNYQRQGLQPDERFFRKVVNEFRAVGLVVGLPIHLSGDESQKSGEARKYADWLSAITGLPVDFQDERFSSAAAEYLLLQAEMTSKQRKARMDKLAAQILLQTYLDARLPPAPAATVEPQFDEIDESTEDESTEDTERGDDQ
ncbi:MAG: Holliday junction resolvase RuvX [Planctomyces sp.]|nr:Holliday junction resolvase RuvX [Planctomyces sp.]